MIEDLRDIRDDRAWDADICIVGAGPSGITIANEFIGSGIRICLVESGGFQEEPDTQALYLGENIGHPMMLDEGRYRVLGGSATRWGGRSAALDPIDFETRSWVKQSGWPVTHRALHPYYERAKVANNFKMPWIPDQEVPKALGITLPDFGSDNLVPFVWRYASPDMRRSLRSFTTLSYGAAFDWGKAHQAALRASSNVHVLLHANMTGFEGSADGSVIESITVQSLTGPAMTIKAKMFVLCCSGVENARLLLNAPEPVLRRINPFDTLGRYFAQHPRGTVAHLRADRRTADRLQRTFAIFWRPRRAPLHYEIGFALSDQAQRRHQLLNASAAIYYDASEASPWKAGRRVRDALKSRTIDRRLAADVATFATGGVSVAQNVARKYLAGRPVILKNPDMRIVVDLEQEPNHCSRITLSETKDRLGLRQAKIDWRISELEKRTARYLGAFIGQGLQNAGMGEAIAADWLADDSPVREQDLAGNYHFIGATRMSSDPRYGVVNPDCRVHGVHNLYVAGCSVFPTGGHANPTLTIVALSIRLADHLRSRLTN